MPGAEHLRDSSDLDSVLQKHAAAGKLLTAICAAPAVVYESKGLLKGKKATCHPAFTDKLSDQRSAALFCCSPLCMLAGVAKALHWQTLSVAALRHRGSPLDNPCWSQAKKNPHRLYTSCACTGFSAMAWSCSAVDQRVVVDGSIITSRGPGTALEFALQLVKELYGKEKADEVAGPMVPPSYQLQ